MCHIIMDPCHEVQYARRAYGDSSDYDETENTY